MHVVIVGCGVAGVTAAITVRDSNPEAEITVYSDENHLYYPRPRLYEVLSGEVEPQEIHGFSELWYEKKGIRVHLNKKAVGIDTAGKKLLLEDGSRAGYDKSLSWQTEHIHLYLQ